MQSDIDLLRLRNVRCALRICHKDHCTNRRDPLLFIAVQSCVGFGLRTSPVIGIYDKHSMEPSPSYELTAGRREERSNCAQPSCPRFFSLSLFDSTTACNRPEGNF